MIDSIRIKNIQSHKDTELNFCSGVNVIVGSSNNGKTAILRSLYWSIYNRPLGIDNLCSHWALDEKGNIKDEMSVEVRKGDDVLIRRKTKNINQYVLNGNELNAIKTDVPPEVKDFYKLNETNIQKQQDAPFLVSCSSGEVARYFNSIAKLDVIDNVLSYADQMKRKEKNNIDDLDKRIKEQEDIHESFSWIDSVQELLDWTDGILAKEEEYKLCIDKLTATTSKHKDYCSEVAYFSAVNKCESYLTELDKIQKEQDALTAKYNKLADEISKYNRLTEIKNISVPIDTMNKYDQLSDRIEVMSSLIYKLTTVVANYNRYKALVTENNKSIAEYKAQLPKVCPLCGHEMEENNG